MKRTTYHAGLRTKMLDELLKRFIGFDISIPIRSAPAMVLLVLSINGTAVAQEISSTSETSTTAKDVAENSPTTKDGRSFAKLTEADVDGLSDFEFNKYHKWKIGLKVAKGNQLDKVIRAKKLELGLMASQAIQPLLAEYKAGKNPTISPELKDAIIKIANGELPPTNMRAPAQELVKYFQ